MWIHILNQSKVANKRITPNQKGKSFDSAFLDSTLKKILIKTLIMDSWTHKNIDFFFIIFKSNCFWFSLHGEISNIVLRYKIIKNYMNPKMQNQNSSPFD